MQQHTAQWPAAAMQTAAQIENSMGNGSLEGIEGGGKLLKLNYI